MVRASLALLLVAASACGDNIHQSNQPPDSATTPDGPLDAPPCVPATTHPTVAMFNTGEMVLDQTLREDVAPLTVPLGTSILFTTEREAEPSPQYGGVNCILQDADPVAMTIAGVHCKRTTAGTDNPDSDGAVRIRWTVITFATGVTVQRGNANTGFTNPSSIALTTPADPTKSFVLLNGIDTGGTGWGNNEFQRASLQDANTLDVRTTVAGSEVAWQVVTMDGATVERGTTTMATNDLSGHVPTTSAGDVVLVSYNTDNASSIAASSLMLEAHAGNGMVQFSRGMGGAALDISWEKVSLPYFTSSFTTAFAASETTKDQAISNLPSATSVAFASNQANLGQSGGSTTYAGTQLDLLGEAAASFTVTDGKVTLERASSNSSATISWSVVDLAHDRCDKL